MFNRRFFDQTIAKESTRLQREKGSLCLILADIDFFKQFNDIYGHQHGDHCLRITSALIKQSTT
ncbi:diguanylate cyclase, partial [Pseudoalteromonas sp. Q36-MNA-CIBAN-0048]|uniref:diguanylate cyclase n=1 Tax=Pseudoalteromonas sp. Q36-MNA-CIBAN-0048 TaxID=3140479 RepID=UPI0033254F8E